MLIQSGDDRAYASCTRNRTDRWSISPNLLAMGSITRSPNSVPTSRCRRDHSVQARLDANRILLDLYLPTHQFSSAYRPYDPSAIAALQCGFDGALSQRRLVFPSKFWWADFDASSRLPLLYVVNIFGLSVDTALIKHWEHQCGLSLAEQLLRSRHAATLTVYFGWQFSNPTVPRINQPIAAFRITRFPLHFAGGTIRERLITW